MRNEGLRLERAVEAVLGLGLLASTALLVGGLAAGGAPALRWGVRVLMVTPMARVLVLTAGLVHRRDWLFAGVSLAVLGILGAGVLVALS